jgi:hypothetical protein
VQPSPPPSGQDEFAGLPRIRPFTDFELDPIEDETAYTGRRRKTGDEPGSGRHAQSEGPGRRHSRAEDNGDDLLARIFAREGLDGR